MSADGRGCLLSAIAAIVVMFWAVVFGDLAIRSAATPTESLQAQAAVAATRAQTGVDLGELAMAVGNKLKQIYQRVTVYPEAPVVFHLTPPPGETWLIQMLGDDGLFCGYELSWRTLHGGVVLAEGESGAPSFETAGGSTTEVQLACLGAVSRLKVTIRRCVVTRSVDPFFPSIRTAANGATIYHFRFKAK